MKDGKDRARIEAVLNNGTFNIEAIKEVVDQIYNESHKEATPTTGD